MKNLSFLIKTLVILVFALFVNHVIAQSPVGYGPRAKSMAGAGTANIENSLWGNLNPGGLVFLGQKIGLGIEIYIPNASYEVIGDPTEFEQNLSSQWPLGLQPGLVEADKQTNIAPQIGINIAINDKSAIGISIFGDNKRSYSYDTHTYYSPVIAGFGSQEGFVNPMGTVTSPTFMKLSQYFAAISYSRKFGEKIGIGLSVVGAWQSLNIGGLEAFGSLNYSTFPNEVSNNDVANSFGAGAKLGLQWNISEQFRLGLAYRTKMFMSTFESYKGIISESGKLDVPSEWNIGIVYHPFEKFLMAFDVNRYCYSQVPAWGLAMRQEGSISLGGDNGGGFGRKDQMSYKLGVQYNIPKWQFRAGYMHTDQPVVDNEVALNLLMPDITTDYASFGLSRSFGKQIINLTVMRGFENSLMGINALDSSQNIELKTGSWLVEIAVEF
jgi:long-chain fatty acid transport protein